MGERQEQLAIDWEAKSIPLYAYKNCLTIKEGLLLAMQNDKLRNPVVEFQKFVSAISIFYDSVENEFVRFYINDKSREDIQRWQIKEQLPTLYEIQNVARMKLDQYDKALLIFRLIKNWSFQYGSFKTYVKAHNPAEAFQYD
jgi:hypothetical protein